MCSRPGVLSASKARNPYIRFCMRHAACGMRQKSNIYYNQVSVIPYMQFSVRCRTRDAMRKNESLHVTIRQACKCKFAWGNSENDFTDPGNPETDVTGPGGISDSQQATLNAPIPCALPCIENRDPSSSRCFPFSIFFLHINL